MVLALAFLLQPLLAGHAVEPHKGIALPLPRNPAQLALVKALWLDMVSVFLPQTVLDLSVFSCVHGGMPKLIITFNGTTPSTFRALFDEHAAQEHFIEVAFSDWIEEVVGQQPSAAKLSGYLRHGELTLRQMTETFREGYSE
jgi:type VI secretion system protein ImpM